MESDERCPDNSAEIGRAAKCKGCPGQALCQANAGTDTDQPRIDVRMNAIKNKILVISGKGGVGKSSMSAYLTMALCAEGQKCGLLDIDLCGPSACKLMNVEGVAVVESEYGWIPIESPVCGAKVMSVASLLGSDDNAVIWRGPRKTNLITKFLRDTFWGRLQNLVIDTPPGTSDEHLSVLKLLGRAKPSGAVIITTPQEVATETIAREITFCRKMGLRILGLVENMAGYACPCCQEVTQIFGEAGAVEAFAVRHGVPYLGSMPLDPTLAADADAGRNPLQREVPSGGVIAVRAIAQRIMAALA
eukprot:m.14067 g.14067  ORF g.14067 m.14067 type:complete len:304 (-) comp2897_c0_seq1:110-1021(-)